MVLHQSLLVEVGHDSTPDPQSQKWQILSHKCILDIKQRIASLYFMITEKLGNKENTKTDLYRFPWEMRNRQELLRKLGLWGVERRTKMEKEKRRKGGGEHEEMGWLRWEKEKEKARKEIS